MNDEKTETKEEKSSSIETICNYLLNNHNFKLIEDEREGAEEVDSLNDKQLRTRLHDCIRLILNDRKHERIFQSVPKSTTIEFKLNAAYIKSKLQQNSTSNNKKQETKTATTATSTTPSKKSTLRASIPGATLTRSLIKQLLNIDAPYTADQILEIEQLKRIPKPGDSQKCFHCLKPEDSNPIGQFDKFLTCIDCEASGHGKCINYPQELIDRLRKSQWQCIECKRCSVCLDTCENLLLCDKCDRGYHIECCDPPLTESPIGDFICHVCKREEEPVNTKVSDNSAPKQSVIKNKKIINFKKEDAGLVLKKKRKLTSIRKQKKIPVDLQVQSDDNSSSSSTATSSSSTTTSSSSSKSQVKKKQKLETNEMNEDTNSNHSSHKSCTSQMTDAEINKNLIKAGLIDAMSSYFTPTSRHRYASQHDYSYNYNPRSNDSSSTVTTTKSHQSHTNNNTIDKSIHNTSGSSGGSGKLKNYLFIEDHG
jgi:hypothetical protein